MFKWIEKRGKKMQRNEERSLRIHPESSAKTLAIVVLLASLCPAFVYAVAPGDLNLARTNAGLANDGFHGANRYMDGWLVLRRGAAQLLPENTGSQLYRPDNSGADNYPFAVLSAWMTDRPEFNTSAIDMLNSEIANTSRSLGGGKPAVLPDHFRLDLNAFSQPSPDLHRQTFSGSEYVKDGLITLTEVMGPNNNPWYDRMIQIVD
ncbi:hypothetical protein OAS39_08635, partial [Pirellulales bacterium]|nr:hypothetical protein [Pirellulales bacterium]